MKKITCNTLFTLFALFLAFTASAQHVEYTEGERTQGYWTLGINGGLSYQQSDVCSTLGGYGVGLTLAKNLYYKPGAFFTFDARGRLLYSQSYGLDASRSYGINRNDALNGVDLAMMDYTKAAGNAGFVFQNHKTHMGEFGIEGVVTFNKLREKTNVILSLFGGVGIDWYKTNLDQRNANGLYSAAYAGIDTLSSVSFIRNNLKNDILDGDYETNAQDHGDFGRVGIMPSLGIELGYQLTPTFSVGLGHKVTFSGTDLLDGQKWENDNLSTTDNDIHHYTNLNLRWIIQPKKHHLSPPVIKIIEPFDNPYTSKSPNAYVRAKITNIKSAMDVDYTVNGQPQRFDFSRSHLTNSFILEQGRNEVVITATNAAGRDQKKVIFIYRETVIDDPVISDPTTNTRLPDVDITRPNRNNETVKDRRFTVVAEVKEVNSERDITFTLNGRTNRNFSYEANRQRFTADINLIEGKNRIRIEARNRDGVANDEVTLYFEEEVYYEKPTVRITKPYNDPHRTKNYTEVIEAEIKNVEWKDNITYKVNGRKMTNFDFGANEFSGYANLKQGKNIIEVIAKNESGEARDQVTIYLEEEVEPVRNLPVVTITDPNQASSSTGMNRAAIKATVLNVDRKNDITFTVNGKRSSNFSFNARTAVFNASINLSLGRNRIVIEGRNANGRDEATVNIEYRKEVILQRPPVVTISQPRNNSSTEEAKTDFAAKAMNVNDKSDLTLSLNGKRIYDFSFSTSRKTVSARLNLREGQNEIRLRAVNEAGEDEASVKVTRKVVQLNPPTVKIIQPTTTTSQTIEVSLKARVQHVSRKQDIQIFLNGKKHSSFNFSTSSKMIDAMLRLKEGSNKILVKVVNNDGKDEDNHTIRYTKPVQAPKVTITSPKNNAIVAKSTIDLQARIDRVSAKKDVTLMVNGKSVKGFSFSKNRLSAKVNLKNGTNTIVVKAVNKGGRDEAKIQVKWIKPIPQTKPVVQFIVPQKSGTSVRKSNANIKVKVLHVSSKKDIKLTLGGRSVKTFEYNKQRKELTASITLKNGNNEIAVEASNSAGKAKAKTIIKYGSTIVISPTKAPKIKTFTMSQPTANPLSPSKGKSRVTATFENVTKTSEITLIVNGTPITNFSYDSKNKKISIVVELIKGQNTVTLKVRTKGGTDEQVKEVNF